MLVRADGHLHRPGLARVGLRAAGAGLGRGAARARGGLPGAPSSTTSGWRSGTSRPRSTPSAACPSASCRCRSSVHLRLWSLAPQRLFTQSRVAALLVSLHGTRLYERRDLDRLEPAQADAVRGLPRRAAGAPGAPRGRRPGWAWDELKRLQALLFAWDWLSLALCLDWAPSELDGPVALALRDGDGRPVAVRGGWRSPCAARAGGSRAGRRARPSCTRSSSARRGVSLREWTITSAPRGAP